MSGPGAFDLVIPALPSAPGSATSNTFKVHPPAVSCISLYCTTSGLVYAAQSETFLLLIGLTMSYSDFRILSLNSTNPRPS